MIRIALLAGILALAGVASAAPVPVLDEDFESTAPLKRWAGRAGDLDAGYRSGQSLHIANADTSASAVRVIALDAALLDGQPVTLRAAIRAKALSDRPRVWNGVKVMLVYEGENGKKNYPQIEIPTGSFDWRVFVRRLRMPAGMKKAQLTVGLEKVSGDVWIDNIEVVAGRSERKSAPRAEMVRCHNLPRLRGVMAGPTYREGDLRTLAEEWGANHIRWQLNWRPMEKASEMAVDLDAYDRWLDGALADCDKALADCEKYGILALVDLHCAPGGRDQTKANRMFLEKKYQDHFVQVWERIARRYRGRAVVWAYDLINEPLFYGAAEGVDDWPALALRAIEAIRSVDPGKPVVFEPGPFGDCLNFDHMEPLPVENVIYSYHMYRPGEFTHQGVHGRPSGIHYPGQIQGFQWNKDTLRRTMQPAIDFQRDFNVPIYIGEFSAVRWAPDGGAHRWLRDVIELFDELGWDWAYHAYREWNGWSVEYDEDPKSTQPSATPTKRKQLLLEWFAKNQRPVFGK